MCDDEPQITCGIGHDGPRIQLLVVEEVRRVLSWSVPSIVEGANENTSSGRWPSVFLTVCPFGSPRPEWKPEEIIYGRSYRTVPFFRHPTPGTTKMYARVSLPKGASGDQNVLLIPPALMRIGNPANSGCLSIISPRWHRYVTSTGRIVWHPVLDRCSKWLLVLYAPPLTDRWKFSFASDVRLVLGYDIGSWVDHSRGSAWYRNKERNKNVDGWMLSTIERLCAPPPPPCTKNYISWFYAVLLFSTQTLIESEVEWWHE